MPREYGAFRARFAQSVSTAAAAAIPIRVELHPSRLHFADLFWGERFDLHIISFVKVFCSVLLVYANLIFCSFSCANPTTKLTADRCIESVCIITQA